MSNTFTKKKQGYRSHQHQIAENHQNSLTWKGPVYIIKAD